MTAAILETILAAFIIIGFISSIVCACACRQSGVINREDGRDA